MSNSQSEPYISAQRSDAILKFFYEVGSCILEFSHSLCKEKMGKNPEALKVTVENFPRDHSEVAHRRNEKK